MNALIQSYSQLPCKYGACFFAIASLFAPVQAAPMQLAAYADMSLDELASIEITSVSKKPERLADAAASIFVITAEDIRRSGAATLPDALRLAPNLHVAQTSSNVYNISARGFNGSSNAAANKLLVMIDGRSVYTPLYSGVFWDTHDVVLEDVERIEVISGPGSTLWGVNAVNGVINVITRSASDTRGTLLSASIGNIGSNAVVRHGGSLGENGSYRFYAKHSDREPTRKEDDTAVKDGFRRQQAGFRADWGRGDERFTLNGNIYDGQIGQADPGNVIIAGYPISPRPISISGANMTFGWDRPLEKGGVLSLQAYFDHAKRDIRPYLSESIYLVDLQMQHRLPQAGTHEFVWGINYRYADDNISNYDPLFGFQPAHLSQKWASVFAQDEISLSNTLKLTLGARVERNPYTGNDFLPSGRLAWKPSDQHLFWSALSRTVRAPARLDRDFYIRVPTTTQLLGGPNTRSEVVKVFELGYRGQLSPNLNYSVTRYRAEYDHLQAIDLLSLAPVSVVFGSNLEGHSNGLEMWAHWQVSPRWRITAGATRLKETLKSKPGNINTDAVNAVGRDPEQTWQLRSAFNIAPDHELDIGIRRSSYLRKTGSVIASRVPDYTAVDARYAWKVRKGMEVSINGFNLFGTEHVEFSEPLYRGVVPRGVFLKVVWQQ